LHRLWFTSAAQSHCALRRYCALRAGSLRHDHDAWSTALQECL